MSAKKVFVALALATALGFLGTASAVAKDDMDMGGDMGGGMGEHGERGASVVPCSLSGVNPAAHPEIFGNPAAAASYGFVRSRNGRWHVRPDCHQQTHSR